MLLGMGDHNTPRGDKSTAQSNGMKASAGQYSGKHREDSPVTSKLESNLARRRRVEEVLRNAEYDRNNTAE